MKIYDAKDGKALEWTRHKDLYGLKKWLKYSEGWEETYENAVDDMVEQNTHGLTDKGNTIIDTVAYSADDSDELAQQKWQLRREIFDLNFVKNWNQYSEQGIRKDGSVGPLWEIID